MVNPHNQSDETTQAFIATQAEIESIVLALLDKDPKKADELAMRVQRRIRRQRAIYWVRTTMARILVSLWFLLFRR